MKKYLLIDNTPSANKNLLQMLLENEAGLVSTTDQQDVKRLIKAGTITAIFIRIELWDYNWFKPAIESHTMPELVLLGKAAQEPKACCGIGLPHFLADDCRMEAVERVLKFAASDFMQVIDYRFILAKDKQEWIKVDLMQIVAVERTKQAVLIHTACGVFTGRHSMEELQVMLPTAGVEEE